MKKITIYSRVGLLILGAFVLGACSDIFKPLEKPAIDSSGGESIVHIYIGGDKQITRTLQPGQSAIEGYQLTFSGGWPTPEPVNLTGTNHAEVALGNGNWTVTAKAYKSGGDIGNADDEIASGSIPIYISNGEVSGTVPNIILRPSDTGSGTLHGEITFGAGIAGYMKLWETDGVTAVSAFGTNGELALTSSINNNYTLASGRYIAEVKLTNGGGDIAFRREIVEIWNGTTTAFVFAPTEFLDPDAVLIYSNAALSETGTTINGVPIGRSEEGNGYSYAPKTYTVGTGTIAVNNVLINLIFTEDSQGSTYSWVANTGDTPEAEAYSETGLPTNFSVNNVLWIKTVSEDGTITWYYKLTIMPGTNYGGFYVAADPDDGFSWAGETIVGEWRDYYHESVITITKSGTYYIAGYGNGIQVLGTNIIADVVLKNANISGYSEFFSSPGVLHQSSTEKAAFDTNVENNAGVTVNLTLEGINTLNTGPYNPGNAALRVPSNTTLVITADSTGSLGAGGDTGIGGNDDEASGTINIEGGIVTANGGNGAGIGGGSRAAGGNVTISGGVVTANGNSGAGIGGGSGAAGGNVTISGGVVTAKSRGRSAGIGGGYGSDGGAVTITGGMVTVSSDYGAAGIGGGRRSAGYDYYDCDPGTLDIHNAVLFANRVQPILTAGQNMSNSIIFTGDTGTMYGNLTLGYNATFQENMTLTILGGTLTIPNGITLTNNGAIINRGIIVGRERIIGSGTIEDQAGVPDTIPLAGSFMDTDTDSGTIGGTIKWTPPGYGRISGYHIYWGESETEKLSGNDTVLYEVNGLTSATQTVPAGTIPPVGADWYLIYSYNELGDSENCLAVKIWDAVAVSASYGGLTISGNGRVSDNGGEDDISIIANGNYTISGTSTQYRFKVAPGLTDVNIILSNVNIDVSAIQSACAFDLTGAVVNLTLTGTNVLKSGNSRAGIEVPDGATLVVTAASTGTLEAIGGNGLVWPSEDGGGAGIGGPGYYHNNDNHAGTIRLLGGTITATGGDGSPGTAGNFSATGGFGGGAGIGGGGGAGGTGGQWVNISTALEGRPGRNGGSGGIIVISTEVNATGGTGGNDAAPPYSGTGTSQSRSGKGGNGASIGGGGGGGGGGGYHESPSIVTSRGGNGGNGGAASGTSAGPSGENFSGNYDGYRGGNGGNGQELPR